MKISLNKRMIMPLLIIPQLIFTCLPIALNFPGRIRVVIQAFLLLMYLITLLFEKEYSLFFWFIILLLIVIMFYWQVWSVEIEPGGFLLSSLCCIEYLTAGLYYTNSPKRKYGDYVLFIGLSIFSINAITTVIGVIKYPLAVRELGKAMGYLSEGTLSLYRGMNIVNWGQLYGMVFSVGCYALLYRIEDSKTIRIAYFILAAISVIAVIASQLTYATIMSLIFFVVIVWKPKTKKNTVILLILLSLIIVVFAAFSGPILLEIINVLEENGYTTLSDKLNDMYQLIYFGNSIGDAAGRFERYSISLKTFLEHPLFGRSIFRGVYTEAYGHHSDFLDMVAFGGILMAVLLLYAGRRYIKYLKRNYDDRLWFLRIQFYGFCIMFIINPVFNFSPIFAGSFLLSVLSANYKNNSNSIFLKI